MARELRGGSYASELAPRESPAAHDDVLALGLVGIVIERMPSGGSTKTHPQK